MSQVVVTGSFDDLRSRHIRFLEEASRLGDLHVLLWSDETIRSLGGSPKFPQEERSYLLQAIRYVSRLTLIAGPVDPDAIPHVNEVQPDLWVVDEANDCPRKRTYCAARGIAYHVLEAKTLAGFPVSELNAYEGPSPRKKIIVTGCYDWLHSGHVRFFEEASQFGDLYVVVGQDENVRQLKGKGHPMFPQEERRYVVQSIRFVRQALISTGYGWMDAEPEIARIHPDIYLVNEDGDKPEKRQFCADHELEYVVLKRLPKPGLPKRQSTALRGF